MIVSELWNLMEAAADLEDIEAGGDPPTTFRTSPFPYLRSGARGIKSVGDNEPKMFKID